MKFSSLLRAAPLVLVLMAPLAQASSAASASLSFSVFAGTGFAWVTSPVSDASSEANAAELTEFDFAANVFSPAYGPLVSSFELSVGSAVPSSTASANAGTVFGNALTFSNSSGTSAALNATALVSGQGKADATAFARSYFSLAPGASVTFQGALFLSATGSNPGFPVNYATGDFYSFASGLLAVGGTEAARELGGPASTGAVGNYSLNRFDALSVTFANTTATSLVSFLDSGVTVYSASAVPEPGSYVLMLAGLGALAFAVRWKMARV